MASASRMTLQEALPQVTTLIVNSDTDDGSLDLQGSASDIDVSQVFILPSLTSFCEVRCFKI